MNTKGLEAEYQVCFRNRMQLIMKIRDSENELALNNLRLEIAELQTQLAWDQWQFRRKLDSIKEASSI